nr:MAG TPA: hypothetical protein [Crassvirales sp.]
MQLKNTIGCLMNVVHSLYVLQILLKTETGYLIHKK